MAVKDEQFRLDIIVNGNKGQAAILELDAANRKLKNTNDDLRTSKKQLEAQGKKNTDEYKKLTQQIKTNSTNLRANKTAIDNHKKSLGLSALSSKQLVQEQRKLKSQLANTVKSLQPEAYAKYEKQLGEVNNELGKLNTNGKKTGGIIGQMKSQVGGLGGLLAGAFSIGAVIQFGNKVAESVSELRKAKSTLQQITGLKGFELSNATNGIKALADTYDKETKEMTIAVHNFAQGMEIDFDEALKLTKQGFIDGADANGEFLDKLREYPALLNEAGFSADQAVALMTQEVKSGIYSDKGVDSIKEANLRLREMTPATKTALDAIGLSSKTVQTELTNGSKTTFDIMQQVSAKLSELPPQSAKVGTAIADIFGGPGEDAGLKYLANLQNIDLTTGQVTSSTNEYVKAKQLELQANERMNEVWSQLIPAGTGLNTMYNSMRIGISNLLIGQQDLTAGLKNEQLEANILVTKLADVNTSEAERQRIITQLNTDYPEFVGNIDLEHASNEQLSTILGQINNQYVNRIILQKKMAEVDVVANSLAEAKIYQQDNMRTGLETLTDAELKLGIQVDLNKTLSERRDIALIKARENTGLFKNEANSLANSLQLLSDENLTGIGGFSEESINKKTVAFNDLTAEVQKFKETSGLLSEETVKTKIQTKELLDNARLRADALLIPYSEESTAAQINALILQQQQLNAKTESERLKAIAIQEKLQEKNKNKLLQLEDKYEKEKLQRLAVSNEAKATLLKDEAIQAATALGAKKELLDAIEAEHKIKIDEAIELDKETEKQKIRQFEAEKTALKNEIDLQNATTQEEAAALKLTQDLEKHLLDLEKTEYNDTQKAELKKAIILKYNNDVDKLTEKAAVKRAKQQANFDKQEIDFETKKSNIKIGLAQQLGNSLIGILGDSLGAQLAGIAFNAIIEIAKLKIATSASQQINMAQAVASAPPPFNIPAMLAAGVQNITLGASSKLQQGSILASAAISGLGATLSKKKGFEDGLYPITRTDGKKFNAPIKNSSHTQMVTQPTYFSDGNYLAGEGGPEIIIDTPTLKNLHPSVIENIYATAASTRGFEAGSYPTQSTSPTQSETSQNLDITYLVQVLNKIDQRLNEPLITGPINIGDNEIARQKQRQEKLDQTRINAKIK